MIAPCVFCFGVDGGLIYSHFVRTKINSLMFPMQKRKKPEHKTDHFSTSLNNNLPFYNRFLMHKPLQCPFNWKEGAIYLFNNKTSQLKWFSIIIAITQCSK